jgi:hypothetical protein
MLITHYYALVAIAGALTAAYLFRPRERTQITSFGAFVAWALAALLGDQVEIFDGSVQQIETAPNGTELAVQTTGELVAAPVPDEIRYFSALWALVSALALILYIWGVYPPETDQTEMTQQ